MTEDASTNLSNPYHAVNTECV